MCSIQKITNSNEDNLYSLYSTYSSPSTRLDEIDYATIPAFTLLFGSAYPSRYINLINWINADWSSVRPIFEAKNDSFLLDKFIDTYLEDLIEYDVLVFVEPRSRKKIKYTVKNVKKGTPCIVEPEGF